MLWITLALAVEVVVSTPAELQTALANVPTSGAPTDHVILVAPSLTPYGIDGVATDGHFILRGMVEREHVVIERLTGPELFDLTYGADVRFESITLSGNGGEVVGGVGSNVSVVFDHARLTGGYSTAGGSLIDATFGSVVVLDSLLEDGVAVGAYSPGGLVQAGRGSLEIRRSILRNGEAEAEGGCLFYESLIADPVITGTIFDGCHASDRCGAVFLRGEGGALWDNAFVDNTTDGDGGGLCLDGGFTVRRNTFCDNAADIQGGGLSWSSTRNVPYLGPVVTGRLFHSVFLNNEAGGDGGAVSLSNFGGGDRSRRDRMLDNLSFNGNRHALAPPGVGPGDVGSAVYIGDLQDDVSTLTDSVVVSGVPGPAVAALFSSGMTVSDTTLDPVGTVLQGVTEGTGNTRVSTGLVAPTTCDPVSQALPDRGAFATGGMNDADGDGFVRPFDCDDGDALRHPGVVDDTCDGVDDDCDGLFDEDAPVVDHHRDVDGDGQGAGPVVGRMCQRSRPGLSVDALDCDDGSADLRFWERFEDGDGDGYGSNAVSACADAPPPGVELDGDCDDGDPDVAPNAVERCNDRDDDCDGLVDQDLAIETWYVDADGDGAAGTPTTGCDRPADAASTPDDCADDDPTVHPLAEEVCDGIDQNCVDGVDDEPCPPTPSTPSTPSIASPPPSDAPSRACAGCAAASDPVGGSWIGRRR